MLLLPALHGEIRAELAMRRPRIFPFLLSVAAVLVLSPTAQAGGPARQAGSAYLDPAVLGRPIAATTVTFHETMFAWMPVCTGSGECPSPPVLGQQTVEAVSSSDGRVNLIPMTNQGMPVRIVVQATVGANAVYDFELEQAPASNDGSGDKWTGRNCGKRSRLNPGLGLFGSWTISRNP